MMQVYHGSYMLIDSVDLDYCKDNKDFGKGFYVTKFRKQAEDWAEIIGKKHKTESVVTEFTFNERAFTDKSFKVLRFSEYNDEWLDFIVLNRNTATAASQHDYDIVEGPVADDKITRTIDDYLAGAILRADFLQMLKHHTETHQICFCTTSALLFLEQPNLMRISKFAHIGEPLVEQLMLDLNIDEIRATETFYASKTFTQLATISTELYKKDWQEIYKMLQKELTHDS
ncbi:DUF3990 domain-containing protein [Candidatus Symbiothrix dinenymphae]|uniref:DUF3990 domain-containing protein n=1 Tax=Candidatus Symbiothrix dinenymphae TaxID=467085 RepID=UPI0006C57E2A|nr:DUF3990 domain-containing protein [Candidatus Symbiothrix dinenymphae]GAP73444.1 hypothetical protein SAMD00024442_9_54 [Candidatus Symbiothrix dinenymphae]